MRHVQIYDTTLRDGAQGEGVNFSLQDKVLIARRLDELGFDFVEGGYPLSNPKDAEFFQRIAEEPLQNAKVCAFGMTRRKGVDAADDPGMQSLLESQAPVLTIVGKTSDFHAKEVLRVSLEENLAMIRDTIAYLTGEGREVIYDAEHFFDGWKSNPEYAKQTIQAAVEGGASLVVMCDTNGGSMPEEVAAFTREAQAAVDVPIGIHTHNDCELGVANALASIDAGAAHVQGTINGLGERCGNADLISVVANLALKKRDDNGKLKFQVLSSGKKHDRSMDSVTNIVDAAALREATDSHKAEEMELLVGTPVAHLAELSRYVYEIANMHFRNNQAFVGPSAFAHKGGMHVHAVNRVAESYEHIKPELVGNERRVLVSELSGRSNIIAMATKHNLENDKALMDRILKQVVDLENRGYQYEAAEASFDLLVKRAAGTFHPHFERINYRVNVETDGDADEATTVATVKLKIHNEEYHEVAEGDGPVNALDSALRKALCEEFPRLAEMQLVDYKVRVINSEAATAASVRVIIESRDSDGQLWGTVGVNENVIEASWDALVDSIEYKLIKDDTN